MVVWHFNNAIVSATVTEQGAASTARELMKPVYWIDGEPRVIWDGARFVLTWMLAQYYGSPYHGYYPGGVGVARVAPDGSLLDSVTYDGVASLSGSIPSWHLASSGREVLLVADRALVPYSGGDTYKVLAAVIHTEGASVKIDPPTTFFEWTSQIASDVIWDGTSYVLAWRYGSDASGWWLALARSFAGGPPVNMVSVQAAATDILAPPAISTSGAGFLIAVSEPPATGDPARVRIYTSADLPLMIAPPPTPTSVKATHVATTTLVTWEAPISGATGFVVDALYPGSSTYSTFLAPGNARSLVVPFTATLVRVRAVNAAGLSAPSAPVAPVKPRHHAARH